jgi:hypothetical protein
MLHIHISPLSQATGIRCRKIDMTQDILEHLNDVLVELKRLSAELDESVSDENLTDSISFELETSVYEPLLNIIDNLDDIITSTNKLDDIDYFHDPYNDGEVE